MYLEAPQRYDKNELDYILTDCLPGTSDIQVIPNLKCSTDHRLVRATVAIKRTRRHCSNTTVDNIDSIDRHTFSSELQERLLEVDLYSQRDPQVLYNSIEAALTQASNTAKRANMTKKNSSKLSTTTIALIEQRKGLYPNRDENEDKKIEYAEIDKQRDIREHNTEAVRSILESSNSTRKQENREDVGNNGFWGHRVPEATG